MTLLPIDILIVVAYLIGMMILGALVAARVDTSRDFFLGGRFLPFWAVGVSVVASDIGAFDMVALSGRAFEHGISVANFDWIGSFPAMVVAAFIFVPYFWRAGVYTIPEFLGRRYDDRVRTTQAVIWIVFNTASLGITFHLAGALVDHMLGWGYWGSILSLAALIAVYTVSGGLTAIVLTDVAQFAIMYIGCLAIIALGLWEAGGISGVREKIAALGGREHHFDLLLPADTKTPYPWTGILFGLGMIMAPAYYTGNQTIVQRVLGARNEWHAKAAMLVGAALKALVPILVVTPGLIALALYGNEIEKADDALPILIRRLLPPGMTGLMFAAFLAALMGNVDSIMNSAATMFTKDLYQRFLRPRADDREILRAGRIFTLLVLACGIASAPTLGADEDIYTAMQTMLSCFQGPTFAILLLGLFWPRCTPTAGFVGLLAGVASAGLMTRYGERIFTIDDPFLYVSIWSFLATVAVCALVTPLTRPHPPERLAGLVYGSVVKREVGGA